MGLSLNDVNRKFSFTWIKCNDDAKSQHFRDLFIKKYGGKFSKIGRHWEWTPTVDQIIVLEPSISKPPQAQVQEPTKTWTFIDPTGSVIKTKNIQEFCKSYDLSRSSLYEVISGKRKSHKGFLFKETTME